MTIKEKPLLTMLLGALCGFALSFSLYPIEALCPSSLDVLFAPVGWVFDMWYSLGLPPRGEAAMAGPFFTWFVLWVTLGAVIGFCFGLRARKARRMPIKKLGD